jgi:hypothetical protein
MHKNASLACSMYAAAAGFCFNWSHQNNFEEERIKSTILN